MNDSRKLPPPSPANTAGAISDSEYRELEARLARSKFRSRFRLGDAELRCLAEHPDHVIAGQCRRFLQLRLAPADPPRDGRQTPMRGHPCFIAQHATGCCCRSCLEKWHHIPKGRALTEAELDRLVAILMRWIEAYGRERDRFACTPDLFPET